MTKTSPPRFSYVNKNNIAHPEELASFILANGTKSEEGIPAVTISQSQILEGYCEGRQANFTLSDIQTLKEKSKPSSPKAGKPRYYPEGEENYLEIPVSILEKVAQTQKRKSKDSQSQGSAEL